MFKKITQSLFEYNGRSNVWRWHKHLMLAIVMIGLNNSVFSQVSGYTFAQSNGTYTPVTGTPILVNGDFLDSAVQNIGFTFNYNATNFTQFIVSADGSMRFGTTTPTSASFPISTATNTNAIAACARDGRSFGGVIVSTTGTAPNRVCVIQWTQYQVHWSAATETINMQIRLFETTNVVQIVYSNALATATTRTAEVGLKGLAGDFNNRTSTTSWVASTAGTLAGSSMTYSTAVALPTNGLTFTWTPPTCVVPSALNITNLTSTSATVNWTASITNPANGYTWELRTTGAAGSGPTGLVSTGNVANTVLTNIMTGLTANTNYTFFIRSNCGPTDLSAWASLPIFTGYCVASSTGQASWISAFTSTGAVQNINYTATVGNTGGYANLMATHRIRNFIDNGITPFTLTAGGPTCGFAIWIDWNNNLIFDATEKIFNTTGFVTTTNGTITIPPGTMPGNYRMRVVVDFNQSNPASACGNINRGEFVDYTFEVTPTPPCVFPTALVSSNILAQSATVSWTASTANPANGYQWEVRTSGAPGSGPVGLAANGSVAAGVVTVNVTGLTPLTSYTFYVRSNCDNVTFAAWVNTSFTTPCLPPTVATTTPATRCGTGTLQLGATTAGTVLNWYAAATGGITLGTGNTFTTPSISATTSYFVSAGNVYTGSNVLGAGGTNSSNTAASFFPGGWGGAKTQYIIRASELIAAGFTAGPITSLGFEPTTSGQAYQGFFVRVGQTTDADSTLNFINTGLTQVFAGAGVDNGFTPVANTVNTLTFNTPFVWNGTSNLVISISWSRVPAAATATSSTMKVDNVGFNSSAFRQRDNLTPIAMQNELSATATGTFRPRFTINGNLLCVSPRTEVVATVTAPPAFSLSTPAVPICIGQTSAPVTIATGAASYNTYAWSPNTGVTGNATTGWTFNPTATTTYTLTASQSGGALCATTTTLVVNVNPVPSPIVITSPVAVCANNIQTLTVTGGSLNNVSILQQNFNGATNNWTTTNLTTGGTPANVAWTLRPSPYILGQTFSSNDASQFYLSNSDSGGSGNNTNASLISPTFSTVGFTSANITFWHFYQHIFGGNGNVQYSINGGTWVNIQSFAASTGTGNGFVNAVVALPAGALNQAAVQIRFQHFATWGWFWAIDNVSILGTQTTNITWAPTTNLFTDAAATVAYTGGSATTLYNKSATTNSQIYTITATTGAGCIATGSVTVNTTAPLLPGTISGAATLCNAGTTTTLTASGATGGTWASSNNAIATVNATTGVVTAVATGSVNITYAHNNAAPCTTLTSPVHTIAVQVTAPPTGAATQSFCGPSNITQLVTTGTGIKWYNAPTGGSLIPTLTSIGLVNGSIYYASQTIAGCESATRLAVTVVINTPVSAGTNGTITLCAGTIPTNAQLFGQLGGTPTVGGTWTNVGLVYTYTVTGIAPCANATATVTVNPITPPNAGTNGTLSVCAGVTPTPALLFASLGGTPNTGGTWTNTGLVYTYTVNGTAPCPSASASVLVTVINLNFVNTTALGGTVGTAYNLNASVTGNTQPVVYSVAPALPQGLTINAATGIISGTPTAATATTTYTVTATQGTCVKTQGFTFAISCPNLTIVNNSLPNRNYNQAYSQTITVSNTTTPVTFTLAAGTLPTGFTLSPAGVISGTSIAVGIFNFTVLATDANGCTVSKVFSIGLNQIPITVTANAITKVFGTANPALTYTVVPALQAGDNFTGALTRVAGENVGTYAISQGNLSAGSNYIITFVGANFTITPASQTITWSQNLVVGCDGETSYQLTATSSSGLPVTYTSQNTAIATINGSTLNFASQGTVAITASQAGNNNYNPATNVVASFVISQPSLIRKHWSDVIFFDNSSNSYSNYQWYKNGVAISGATLQYFKENGNLNGVYHATAMRNGVMITSCTLHANDSLPAYDIKLYPNPVRPGDTFEVENTLPISSLTNAKIRVYNVSGAFVGQTDVTGALTTVNAPTTQGVYIVKLVLDNGNVYTVNLLVK